MTKVRVHELAKELNKSNKEVLDVLREKNIEVTSHMSSLRTGGNCEKKLWRCRYER